MRHMPIVLCINLLLYWLNINIPLVLHDQWGLLTWIPLHHNTLTAASMTLCTLSHLVTIITQCVALTTPRASAGCDLPRVLVTTESRGPAHVLTPCHRGVTTIPVTLTSSPTSSSLASSPPKPLSPVASRTCCVVSWEVQYLIRRWDVCVWEREESLC